MIYKFKEMFNILYRNVDSAEVQGIQKSSRRGEKMFECICKYVI